MNKTVYEGHAELDVTRKEAMHVNPKRAMRLMRVALAAAAAAAALAFPQVPQGANAARMTSHTHSSQLAGTSEKVRARCQTKSVVTSSALLPI